MYYSGRSSERAPFGHEKGVRNWSWPLTETFHCMYSHDTYSCIVWYTWGILFDFRNLIFITCSYTTVESHFLKCLTLYNKNQNWLPFPRRILAVMGFLSDEIIQFKFVKLWDFLGYSKRKTRKRPTYQKTSVSRQIVSEIFAQLWSDDSMQILLNLLFFIMLRNKSNLEWYVYSHVVIISSFIEQCQLHCS